MSFFRGRWVLSDRETTRVFVDCDPGIDDAVALAYLAARPEVEILGVGAVFGNNTVAVTAQNALRLLELYGRPEVPVAVGAERPLVQAPRLAEHVHGGNGLGDVELPDPKGEPVAESAAELLVRLARENPGELDVLAVGPLTNVALAIGLEPRLPQLVRRLVVMGGAVEVAGNVGSHAEANIVNDPEAAEAVFAAGFDLDLVALDITMKTVATAEWLDRLKEVPGDRAERTSAFLDFYAEFYKGIFGLRQCAMHDPLAAAVLADPHLVTEAFEAPVRVELTGTLTRGMTVADRRPRPRTDERRACRVVTSVSEDAFLDLMLDALR
ncbi:nucleoside hydrolase [Nocardiopsis sp. MG754419]|uniref:nucleoside hydrolase n=1 Tax=Nocardiopsis sp. MG754419 TaxID=2259865 RepID=UPI001BA9DC76|nr:nucleoside hydrolase [Nocardiopsis sp. MG754419]MBR8740542.1 nucleoside hydrolase [Nocardiopsis sp. MG754419]